MLPPAGSPAIAPPVVTFDAGQTLPDRRIFDHTLGALGATEPGIHVGDSWPADIAGALAAGWRAVWYGRRAVAVDDPRVAVAHTASEVRAIL